MCDFFQSCFGSCGICCRGICPCCKNITPPEIPTFNVTCVGVTNAGKTTLISVLNNEVTDAIVPTIGFIIKEIKLSFAKIRIKELGGGNTIRQHWLHYFGQESGLIFVIDGLCDHECLELTRQEMQKILNLEHFKDKPWLILCNKQDVEGASTAQKVIEELKLRDAMDDNPNIMVKSCSKTNRHELHSIFENFGELLYRYASEQEPDRYPHLRIDPVV